MSEKEFKIDKECELRILMAKKSIAKVVLLDGRAEIFGSELALNESYSFSHPTEYVIPVFTWHGCTLKVEGSIDNHYIARETPMAMYLNAHACLERLRLQAEEDAGAGPTTIIVGPSDVGKSSLCRILLNYAVREGRKPIFVDIDVSLGSISIPGTIGAAVIENEIPVGDGLGIGLPHEVPFVYNYGKCSPSLSSHYLTQVTRLSEIVREKLLSDPKALTSGAIINTCGLVRDDGYKRLLHEIAAFEVDVILVIEDYKLYNYLNRDLPAPFIKIHFVPKSDGIKKSDRDKKKLLSEDKISEYFFGSHEEFESYSFHVPFSHLQIYEIVRTSSADDEPTGGGKIVPVEISKDLKKRILAVSSAAETNDLITSPVLGFICPTKINMEEQKVTVLSPQPKPLPNAFYLLTSESLPSHKKSKEQ